jgi:hypothetical protein
MRKALLVVALAALAVPAAASGKIVASYCSPETGDYCVAIKRDNGHVYFDVGTFSFRSYTLCVTPPKGRGECKSFKLRRSQGWYRSIVRWDRQFTNRGPGSYRVRWKVSGSTIARLSFVRR